MRGRQETRNQVLGLSSNTTVDVDVKRLDIKCERRECGVREQRLENSLRNKQTQRTAIKVIDKFFSHF